eukprot:4774229-Pyramimonas_sp.AAC.1
MAEEAIRVQEELVAETDRAILQINEEQARLAASVPRPPEANAVDERVEALAISVGKLGSFLQGLGDDGTLTAKL